MATLGTLQGVAGGQQMFQASAVVTFPSAVTLTSVTVNVAITGLQIDDIVTVCMPVVGAQAGLMMDATYRVAVADQVTMRVSNAAGTVTPTSQTALFRVFRNNVPI